MSFIFKVSWWMLKNWNWAFRKLVISSFNDFQKNPEKAFMDQCKAYGMIDQQEFKESKETIDLFIVKTIKSNLELCY
jgi:hypothetical protein